MEASLTVWSPSASLLLDLADELWFSHSVVPFPSFSLPCLPLFSSLFSHSPDPSTLLAQLMFSTCRRPPSQQRLAQQYSPWDLPACHDYHEPSHAEDEDAYHSYPVYSCCKDEGKDAYLMRSYGKIQDAYLVPQHGNPASSYCKDDHPPGNHGGNSENAVMIVENCDQDMAVRVDIPSTPIYLDAEDALSGIHDVGSLLRDQQHHQGKEDMQHYKWRQDMVDVVLPESWPQDEKESKDVGSVETNMGSSKRARGSSMVQQHGISHSKGCAQ